MLFQIGILLLFLVFRTGAQDMPVGYISCFKDDFTDKKISNDIVYSSYSDLKQTNGALVLKERTDSLNIFFPSASFLIGNNIFGDFVAKVRLKTQSLNSDSPNNFYILSGLRDSLNYYITGFNENETNFNQMYRGVNTNIKGTSRNSGLSKNELNK